VQQWDLVIKVCSVVQGGYGQELTQENEIDV
jgi:hypothetical protein